VVDHLRPDVGDGPADRCVVEQVGNFVGQAARVGVGGADQADHLVAVGQEPLHEMPAGEAVAAGDHHPTHRRTSRTACISRSQIGRSSSRTSSPIRSGVYSTAS